MSVDEPVLFKASSDCQCFRSWHSRTTHD